MDRKEPIDSPFLAGVSLGPSSTDVPESHAEALTSGSPFQTAFELVSLPDEALDELADEAFLLEDEETGIISGENRVRITNTTAVPFRWICRIDVQGTRDKAPGGGTGVLVSNRHVLTAAHIVYDAARNMQNFTIRVKPALNYGDEPLGSYTVSATPKLPRLYRPDADNSLDFDYALLTLNTAIGQETFKALKGTALSYWGSPTGGANSLFARPDPLTLRGKAVVTAGYPRSAGARKMLCAPGFIVSVDRLRRTMLMTADATHGQSGSPVWIVENGRYCLVGIAAGAGKSANTVVRVTRELVRQVRAWITADGDSPSMVESEAPLHSASIALSEPELEDSEAVEALEDGSQSESWNSAEAQAADEPETHADASSLELDEHFAGEEHSAEETGVHDHESIDAEYESTYEDERTDDETELSAWDAADHETLSADESAAGKLDDSEVDVEHLLEHAVPPAAGSPTLGFEFDLNFGFEEEITTAKGLTPPAGWNWPSEGLRVTDHVQKTAAGDWKDAIHITMDAVRMEIATAPIHIHDDSEFDLVVKQVTTFGQELVAASTSTFQKEHDNARFGDLVRYWLAGRNSDIHPRKLEAVQKAALDPAISYGNLTSVALNAAIRAFKTAEATVNAKSADVYRASDVVDAAKGALDTAEKALGTALTSARAAAARVRTAAAQQSGSRHGRVCRACSSQQAPAGSWRY